MPDAAGAANDDLDQARVERLTTDLLRPLLENFRVGPLGPDRVCEALHSLADVTAMIITRTDDIDAMQDLADFFQASLAADAPRRRAAKVASRWSPV